MEEWNCILLEKSTPQHRGLPLWRPNAPASPGVAKSHLNFEEFLVQSRWTVAFADSGRLGSVQTREHGINQLPAPSLPHPDASGGVSIFYATINGRRPPPSCIRLLGCTCIIMPPRSNDEVSTTRQTCHLIKLLEGFTRLRFALRPLLRSCGMPTLPTLPPKFKRLREPPNNDPIPPPKGLQCQRELPGAPSSRCSPLQCRPSPTHSACC